MFPAISKIPAHLDLHKFLLLLDELTICPGHPDHHLISMAKNTRMASICVNVPQMAETSETVNNTYYQHTHERWLNSPQIRAKAAQLKERVRSTEKRVKYLENKIKASMEKLAVNIDYSLHNDLQQIIRKHIERISISNMNLELFIACFGTNNLKPQLLIPCTRRHWHPMLIRWCLHLRMLSPAAYDALRGVLTLPCGQTLQDYAHCITAVVGIQV